VVGGRLEGGGRTGESGYKDSPGANVNKTS
jgi:hypothetical protein